MQHFTENGTDQCQNDSSNLLTPCREQPRSTRTVVAYPRPAFAATKRINHAPISFDQQAQVFQCNIYTEIRKIEIPRSMVVGDLSWRSRRASQHLAVQSPGTPEKAPRILPVRRSLSALVVRTKQTVVRDRLFPQKSPVSRL